jgi:glutamyl-tRNA synthetase
MEKKVRVRFAPSPTGPLHIGGVRTALFNYLFARKHGGDFILRIEDTDQLRYVEGSEKYIIDSLAWCGLTCDEGPYQGGSHGPYRQSERKAIYQQYAEMLLKKGSAYYAFDSQESLEQLRGGGESFSYNPATRDSLLNSLSLPEKETQLRLERGDEYVIRFKSPAAKTLVLEDLIRGQIKIDSGVLDDKVLFKSDGMPTYHLANVVDDHLMEVSHVIRGEEWLPSLALHFQLYEAFGWEPPCFAHLPLILKPEGKGKLSKRDGEKMGFPVFPLQWGESMGYRETGYFPEAVVNFLALLGWNPGTEQEIFSIMELITAFSLERVHKSGARFDPDKTKWYNHQYLQQKSAGELALLLQPIIREQLVDISRADSPPLPVDDLTYIARTIDLLKDRATFVTDFWDMGSFFYTPPQSYSEAALKKHWKENTPELLTQLSSELANASDFSSATLEEIVKQWIVSNGLSFGKIMAPLRLVLVGDLKGPHLYDIMELLGKERTTGRISEALRLIG